MTIRPRRFCLVTTFYPPFNFGGDGITVRRLAHALAERGHHVEVVHCVDAYDLVKPAGTPPVGDYQDHPAIVHHALRSRAGPLSPLVTHLTGRPGLKGGRLRTIFGGRFDVVHFHNASLIGVGALPDGPALTLYTMHDHWLVCPMHVLWRFNREPCPARRCVACTVRAGRPPQVWRHTGILADSLARVDAFIAPSRFTRDKHLEQGLRVTAPIVHIPNFSPHPAPPSGEVAPHPVPYFLFAGRLERIKGAHVLVDLFSRYRGADLLIAGDGHEAPALRAAAMGNPQIHFLGVVASSRLEALMRHAVAVLVPSVGYEVFPTTVLEAFAVGTPVIGHRLGPVPEMLEGRGGLTYGDESELLLALETLVADPGRRRALGAQAQATWRAEWTVERHLERYEALIADLSSEAVLCG